MGKTLKKIKEWLLCPSKAAIRERIFFEKGFLFHSDHEVMNEMVRFVEEAPRSERRIRLKLLIGKSRIYDESPRMIKEIISYLQ